MVTTGDALTRLDAWRAGGERWVTLRCTTGGAGAHQVWTRIDGQGDWLTALHGFPTSSFDMDAVVAAVSPRHTVLCLDMIGFGESDRPLDHVYRVTEQADAVTAAWAFHGVTETHLFAHDLGASVAQELLWRAQEGVLPVRIRSVVLANGGIYPDLHRPLPFQTALADPEHGAALAASLTEAALAPGLRATFGPAHQPTEDERQAMWSVISRDGGNRNLHLLIRYMDERRERATDWVGALESARMPLGFVWGMLDPISGAHIAERIVERFPTAPRRLLEDVGHWPPLEAPQAVASMIEEVVS